MDPGIGSGEHSTLPYPIPSIGTTLSTSNQEIGVNLGLPALLDQLNQSGSGLSILAPHALRQTDRGQIPSLLATHAPPR